LHCLKVQPQEQMMKRPTFRRLWAERHPHNQAQQRHLEQRPQQRQHPQQRQRPQQQSQQQAQ